MSWKQFLKIFLFTAVGITAAAAMAVLLLSKSGVINAEAVLRRRSAARTAEQRADNFVIRFPEDSAVAGGDSALLVAMRSESIIYDEQGNTVASLKTSMANPCAYTSGEYFVSYDAGGADICVFSASEYLYSAESEGIILSVAVNECGWTAVCSTEDRYRGAVTVYNASGEAVYKLYSAEAYPVAAQVSPKNYGLAVLRISDKGSSVDFYDMRRDGSQASFGADGVILADIRYLNNDRIVLVGSSKIFITDSSGKQIGVAELGRNGFLAYAVSDGFVSVLTDSDDYSGDTSLMTLDADCRVISAIGLESGVSIAQSGRYLMVLSDEQIDIYNKRLQRCDGFDISGRRGIPWMRTDGSAAIISGSAVYSFE